METYTFTPIGHIRSCFTEKFGIPRQPGLAPSATAQIELLPAYARPEAFRHLDRFSHIWVLFVFHRCRRAGWQPTVRPPRLGGNRRVGVFASRSGFRPNPIGQSVVELVAIQSRGKHTRLQIAGIDLLDGTPVLDIKPYLPYADSRPEAAGGYAATAPALVRRVRFSDQARAACDVLEQSAHPRLGRLIAELLALDPRPGYATDDSPRIHGMRLWDLNIRFSVNADQILVTAIDPADP